MFSGGIERERGMKWVKYNLVIAFKGQEDLVAFLNCIMVASNTKHFF